MAKTLLQQAEEALTPTGVTPKSLRINRNRKGVANTAVITLPNGREISVDMEGNWQENLQKHVNRFKNKKPVDTKDGDKA